MRLHHQSKANQMIPAAYSTRNWQSRTIGWLAWMILLLTIMPETVSAQGPALENQSQIGSEAKAKSSPRLLKVLSYNIHHGEGMDRKLDLKRIAGVIIAVQPDLVALQEVDVNVKRSNSIDQAKTIADICKMKFAFGGNIKLQGGEYGNAILSKYEIVKSSNKKLPNHDLGEQRGILTCKIKLPNVQQPIEFSSTHFDHRRNDAERFESVESINRLFAKSNAPISIIAGDFNDVVFGRTITELEKSWVRSNETILPTIPVAKPNRQIDFVFSSKKSKLTCVKTTVLDETVASDHRPVLAIFQLD